MESIPIDIINLFFVYLNTKDLIWASRTCKQWRYIFKKYIGKYKLDLRQWRNKITDQSLKNLKGAHTINLSYCNQITNRGLEHLKGVHTIYLYNCNQITDQGLEHLKGVHTIYLYYCNQITNQGLEILRNVNPTAMVTSILTSWALEEKTLMDFQDIQISIFSV